MRASLLTRRAALALAGLLFVAAAPAHAQLAGGVSIGGSVVRFATLAEAQAELVRDDAWMATAGDFHRSSLLGRSGGVTTPELKAHLAKSAQAWPPEQERRWRAALEQVAPRITALKVKLPPVVLLVATDGTDSANAPYTRGAAIFLPLKGGPGVRDDALIAHELFHVISRNDPALATRAYSAFGFEPAGELAWPPEWAALRISNPDAPYHRHVVRIDVDGQSVPVMPLLVATRTALQPGESFFSVLEVRLLAVAPGPAGGTSQALRTADGKPRWYPADTPSYLQKLGGNTPYIIHPEETAADHFAFLVTGRTVRNPALLRRFGDLLQGPTP